MPSSGRELHPATTASTRTNANHPRSIAVPPYSAKPVADNDTLTGLHVERLAVRRKGSVAQLDLVLARRDRHRMQRRAHAQLLAVDENLAPRQYRDLKRTRRAGRDRFPFLRRLP